MKFRIVLTALLIILLSAGINSQAGAAPWRNYRHGWYKGYWEPRHYTNYKYYSPHVVVSGEHGSYYSRSDYYYPRYYTRRHYNRYCNDKCCSHSSCEDRCDNHKYYRERCEDNCDRYMKGRKCRREYYNRGGGY